MASLHAVTGECCGGRRIQPQHACDEHVTVGPIGAGPDERPRGAGALRVGEHALEDLGVLVDQL